jgi:hypothetical protein
MARGPTCAKLDGMLAWTLFGATCAIAIGRCLLAIAPADNAPADAATRAAAFDDIASHESEMRAHAAEQFPTDPWSQDDCFHEQERSRARDFARRHGVRVSDVLDAIDEGLHDSARQDLVATVPPCRPRAIY